VIELKPPLRLATTADADALAELVEMASDGMATYLWGKLARPGQTAMDVGRERARTGAGGFSFEHTVIREVDGEVAACLIGYPVDGPPAEKDPEMSAVLAPLVELGNLVPEKWYLNVLATFPQYRGQGLATELLRLAEDIARDAGHARISLTTADINHAARGLYRKHGYEERATRPMFKEDWEYAGDNWVLLVKEL
jgi:ribosomal protein S18 acetylase RimI-like enzyme